MRSTKAEVSKLEPECARAKYRCVFELDNSEVMIIFSGYDGLSECNRIKPGTVLAVIITFHQFESLQKFQLRNTKVEAFSPSSPTVPEYKGYYYPREGLIISAFNGQAYKVAYVATQKDSKACPEYYEDPTGMVMVGLFY